MYRTTSGMHDPPQLSDSNRGIMANHDHPPTLRVYQTWKGNNVFCLEGTLIFGPDFRSLFLTISLIVTPVIFFCAFVSQKLIHEFQNPLGNTIVIASAVFTAYVIVLLFLTSARDPGIIPRNPHPPDDDSSNVSAEWPGIHGGAPTLPPTKDVMVNGVTVRVKYCQTCMLYRPPRCSHCSICNNCVERFDHHCPWVGQCIGKRNYRFFFMFVSSTTTLCIYILVFCWVNIGKIMARHHCNVWRALQESPVSGVLILYTFVCVWFVGGLTTFHLYLIFTNQTTYENFRYRYDGKMNPYNMGLVRNVLEIFCSRISKSRNNFREIVKVDSLSAYSNSVRLGGHALSPDIRKSSFGIESGKRRGVAEEDLEDIESQIERIGGLERCGTLPRHPLYDPRDNWEVAAEVRALAAEFGSSYGLLNRQRL